ncbi:MFS transporter [Nonomuraea sp. NPDC049421]|uniref:MFS transporter n=1 Tax=Nonomuraea sp. NPDC049421 TaxID=3155275 RepID=UPI003412F7CC
MATAYALPAAGFTLLCGRIADLAGRRRMFLAGLVLLCAASLGGGLADGLGTLLAARAAQGLATAISMPAALALITTTFAEGPLRDRALGLNGAITAAGFTTGALLGGVLTELTGWRGAFLVVLSALDDAGVAVAAGVTLSVAALAVLRRGARSGGRGSASVRRGPTPPARTSG